MNYVGVVFINWTLLPICAEQLRNFNSLGDLKFSFGPIWLITQLNVIQSQYQKLHLVIGDGQLGLCLLYYLETSLGLTLYILGGFFCIRFSSHASTAPELLLSLPVFPVSPHLILLF